MGRDRFEVLDAARKYVKKHTEWKEMENSVGIPQSLGDATRETWIVERPGREEMFKAGVEWADAHPHWISVDEQKPPYNESVLLYGKVFDYVVIGELLEEYGRDIYYDDEGSPYHYESITHWMPQPAKPKGGEE
jgi:hypothetical protein